MTSSAPAKRTVTQMLASLKAQLPSALPTTMTATGPTPTAGNDLYEAYLFGLVIEAARLNGYAIEFETPSGVAKQLHLRRSPGRLNSPGSGGQPFTHAVLSVGTRPPLELHTGVVVAGRSHVVHEVDVLLIIQEEAERCRRPSVDVDPRSGKARMVVEAKYYTKPVDLATSREFLGLSKDLSARAMVFACTVGSPSAIALLAGTPSVEYDTGVLPFREGEASFRGFVKRLLRDYRDRRTS